MWVDSGLWKLDRCGFSPWPLSPLLPSEARADRTGHGTLWELGMDKAVLVIAARCGAALESIAFCCVRIKKQWPEFGDLARMAGLAGLVQGTLPASSLAQMPRAQLAVHLETPQPNSSFLFIWFAFTNSENFT